jgi:hypothetical protein
VEIVLVLPGNLVLDVNKCKLENGILKPVYKRDDELTHWVNNCKAKVIEAVKETLYDLNPEEAQYLGGASDDVAPYWAH